MNRLGELLRNNVVTVSAVGALLVLLLVWQFAWMSPKAAEVASDRQTVVADQVRITQLDLQIETLIQESEQVRHLLPFLRRFPQEIPPQPQYGVLVHEIQNLEQQTGVSVNPLSVPHIQLGTSGVTSIPVNMSVAGSHDGILAFLAGLTGTGPHAIARLVTVQSFALNNGGATTDVLAPSSAPYSASLSCTAYTTAVQSVVGAGSIG
jgi:Tfp pilus assembly protein PilO